MEVPKSTLVPADKSQNQNRKVAQDKNLADQSAKTCSEALSQYLISISENVNQAFFK